MKNKKDKNEIFGVVSLCVSAIATTLVTYFMTKKEIKSQVEEVITEMQIEKKEQES